MPTTEKTSVSVTLNGEAVVVSAPPDTPLLYALRGELGLKGTRFGCGEGFCGACTVIVDGRAVAACDVPLHAVAGKSIETIEALSGEGLAGEGLAGEGLAGEGKSHPLVQALVAAQAAQCGYCLPGIVMKTKALLDETPRPTRAEIAAALDDNLCRCGTQFRILNAIERFARDGARIGEAGE